MMAGVQGSGFRVQRNRPRGPFHIVMVSMGILLAGIQSQAQDPAARDAFQTGLKAYAASNYPTAVESFVAAAAAAPAERLDPSMAHFNAALAAAAAGELETAASQFALAANSSDLGLQAKAYYNRGNTLLQLAESPTLAPAPQTPDAGDARGSAIGEALRMYENAIALDPNDLDAKKNYELALKIQQQQPPSPSPSQEDNNESEDPDDSENQDSPPPPDSDSSRDQPDDQQPQPSPQDPPSKDPAESDSQGDIAGGSAQRPESEGDMSRDEAEMLLDALKAQEQSQRDRLHPFFGAPVPVEKDW